MRRFSFFILLTLFVHMTVMAAFHSVNVDGPTISAMGVAYQIETETEHTTKNALDSILNKYGSSNISMAQIFLVEKKRHNAMLDVKFFDSSEFYYYQRIKYLAADLIMPKFIKVAYGMLQRPENALYWGPYLYKATNSVLNLCKQFEVLVTSGKRSFKDVKFLVLNETLGKYFNLANIDGVDWKATLDHIGEFGQGLSWEEIKEDFSSIQNTLAAIGGNTVNKSFTEFSNIGKIFHASTDDIVDMYEGFKEAYKTYNDAKNAKDIVMSVVTTCDAEGVQRLFNIDDYNITQYMQSYIDKTQDRYYTQKWYIKKKNSGSNVLAEYKPVAYDNYDDSRWNTAWNHYISPRDNEYCHTLTYSETQELKSKVNAQTGWTTTKIAEYNAQNPGHNCYANYSLKHENRRESYKHGMGSTHHKRHCFYSYSVKVIDSWNTNDIVYEETYDSKTMDKRVFKQQLETRLKHYRDSIVDKDSLNQFSYEIVSDSPIYYEEANAQKIKGHTSVTFVAKCGGGGNLAKGSWSWKENGNQGNSLDEKSERFAMGTDGSSNNNDNADVELNNALNETNKEIASLQKEISDYNLRLNELQKKIIDANINGDKDTAGKLQAQYDELAAQRDSLQAALRQAQAKQNELSNAKNEYYKDLSESAETESYRIPRNMKELTAAYKILWLDEGKWDRNAGDHVWVRHGYSESGKFNVTYTAKLSLQRRPKKIFGIRIHRAILSVDFELTSEQSGESVVESMQLDGSVSEEELAQRVNERYAQIRRDLPDCTIEIKYNRSEAVNLGDEDEDGLHLLFASDRLEIARNIENQLVEILAHLQMIERVQYVDNTIERFLKGMVLDFMDKSKKKTVVEAALYRWRDNAKKVLNSFSTSIPKGDKDKDKDNSQTKKL